MTNRTLGTINMLCAPALLIQAALFGGIEDPLSSGIASMIFMAGWMCSNIALQRMRAAGSGAVGKAVLIVQFIGLALACAFGFFEATGLLGDENVLFAVTDLAWPGSMLFMIVVGIAVARARRLRGWHRWAPLVCGMALPLTLPLFLLPMEQRSGALIFFTLTTVFWILLGHVVRSEEVAVSAVPAASAA